MIDTGSAPEAGEIDSFRPEDHHPTVTVDVVVFTVAEEQLRALLIKRQTRPFAGEWALPGGFVGMDERLDEAAGRVLYGEAGVSDIYLEQLYTFGDPGRDPRTRVITVTYYALVASGHMILSPMSDEAVEAGWFDALNPPSLAFDHKKMLDYAVARIRSKIDYSNIAFQLLPDSFTLSDLQHVYEVILGNPLDKRNFRKKIRNVNIVEPVEGTRREGPHRPAQLYRFARNGNGSRVSAPESS